MSDINKSTYERDWPYVVMLLVALIAFYHRILFTDLVIRAPDILHEFYWSAIALSKLKLSDVFLFDLKATWHIEPNSGYTLLGGGVSGNFNFWSKLIFIIFPLPAAVAWHIVFHFFLGAAGLYWYCRIIGASRPASFVAGIIFALAPEMATLINAGHVMKIATISFAPWAFFLLEKGFLQRRVIYFMSVSLVLALQFFCIHWQIAYYTCLSVGLYGIVRLILVLRKDGWRFGNDSYRLIVMNLVTMFFFLSTVAISLMPLSSWSTDTNRGAQSGANQGTGGLNREEAMSWSMPPEEIGAFAIPGFFGFSRQEAGPNPSNIRSFYWGRMVFSQTTSYIGLLPWLLLPLPIMFRRNRYTLLAMLAITVGIFFSMGKYTPFYNFLFDYFPGINRFRVPKMMMFMPVIGLGVIAALGVDVLRDETLRATRAFKLYLAALTLIPILFLMLMGSFKMMQSQWLGLLIEQLAEPTRYEQGQQLIWQRWNNIIYETGLAVLVSGCHAAVIIAAWRWKPVAAVLPLMLLTLFIADVGRVNAKFMPLTEVPQQSKEIKTPVVDFLSSQSKEYRMILLGGDSTYYNQHGIPVLFTPQAVQQVRWQEILDVFSFNSSIPDMLNLRYLVATPQESLQLQRESDSRYVPVFTSPDGNEVVLENRNVMPKAWLVPSVIVVQNRQQTLQILQHPQFDPRKLALVESNPPIQLAPAGLPVTNTAGKATVNRYEGELIEITAAPATNSLLVIGEKYYKGWKALVDGKESEIVPVNHILRGVYLTPGKHTVEFKFDPLPFKIGKYLTLASFAFFAAMLIREWFLHRKRALT